MSNTVPDQGGSMVRRLPQHRIADVVNAGLRRRYAAEMRFRFCGLMAVAVSLAMLGVLFSSILGSGLGAFQQTRISLDITFDARVIDPDGALDIAVLSDADYDALVKAALRDLFPDVQARRDRRELYSLVSTGAAYQLRDMVLADPLLIGKTVRVDVLASADMDMLAKGNIARDIPESARRISDQEMAWFDHLSDTGRVSRVFNQMLFTAGDSRQPELAGIRGALIGSLLTLAVTLALSFPIGVGTAIYLEEFAPRNRWTDLIEVNINNLAAVPSIVFGLLGLAVFLQVFGLPRSAPLAGGLVLTLMTLPTIIIAARTALKSVPPSIREAALGMGASKLQMIFHHVLPLAMPGMLTGTIIGMAQALGETAPLLMIGMVAFVADVPGWITDPSTVLPVQIYLWADSPERAFVERTSAAIIVLLGFLIVMNAAAVLLRKKFERRW
ncbi:phosphate ABC transporter permease PstA [Haematospirillum sp. H1815]|nr:phosphate ABC transporter permease PstA [Haematospirillum sp. H1815]